MEEKINIAEILKNKPMGTKLYADAFGELSIEDIYAEGKDELGITLLSSVGDELIFYNDGRYDMRGEPILVPSKGMRDWEKFAWKRGDVLVNSRGLKILFDRWANDNYTSFYAKTINLVEDGFLDTNLHTLASEKEAKSFIKCIEEKLGGKLNRETLKIENAQPEFKDGDVVVVDEIPFDLYSKCIFILKENLNTGEIKARAYVLYNVNKDSIFFDTPVTKLIERNIHLATDEEKQRLFDALAKEGKSWDGEKKEVVDLKPKVELKPFDKVLCRNSKDDTWEADFFARLTRKEIDYTQSGKYLCVGDLWMYCIPYNEETAHLLGTTDEWEGGEG